MNNYLPTIQVSTGNTTLAIVFSIILYVLALAVAIYVLRNFGSLTRRLKLGQLNDQTLSVAKGIVLAYIVILIMSIPLYVVGVFLSMLPL